MAFLNNFVTLEGQALIAQATAANPIVFTKGAGNAAYVDAPAPLSDRTASILSASADGTTARVMIRFENQGDAGTPLKSFGAFARLQSDSGDGVLMLFSSDPDASVYVPSTTEPPAVIDIELAVAITEAGTAEAVPAPYAAPGDLLRFMSKHKAGDVSTGEDETVLGVKTFSENTMHGGSVILTDNGIVGFQAPGGVHTFLRRTGLAIRTTQGTTTHTMTYAADNGLSVGAAVRLNGRSSLDAVQVTPGRIGLYSGGTDAAPAVLIDATPDAAEIASHVPLRMKTDGTAHVRLDDTGLYMRATGVGDATVKIEKNGQMTGCILPLFTISQSDPISTSTVDVPVGGVIPCFIPAGARGYNAGREIGPVQLAALSADGAIVDAGHAPGIFRILLGVSPDVATLSSPGLGLAIRVGS